MKNKETVEQAQLKFYIQNTYITLQKIGVIGKICLLKVLNGKKKRMYSEEEVLDLLYKRDLYILNRDESIELELPEEWFEKFRKNK